MTKMPILLATALLLSPWSNVFSSEDQDKTPKSWPVLQPNESVAEYSWRVGLPEVQTVDLGNSVTLEMRLIPPGKNSIGTPSPVQPQRPDRFLFYMKVIVALALLLIAGTLFLSRRNRTGRPFQIKLVALIFIFLLLAVVLYSCVNWYKVITRYGEETVRYQADKARFSVSETNERPSKIIVVDKPFYISATEVTQEQFYEVTGMTPPYLFQSNWGKLPITWLSETPKAGQDIQVFLKNLTVRTHLDFRLPSEGEWEFSCRAGSIGNYYSGDSESDLAKVGWYTGNTGTKVGLSPVGLLPPNKFGLHDMHGNANEICETYFALHSLVETSQKENYLMARGGSWVDEAHYCRSASRRTTNTATVLGLRLVLEVPRNP